MLVLSSTLRESGPLDCEVDGKEQEEGPKYKKKTKKY